MPWVLPADPMPPKTVVSLTDVLMRAKARVAENDVTGALRAFAVIEDSSERADVRDEFIATLANEDPSQAARVALAMPAGFGQSSALDVAARSLVQRNADEALGWALALPEPATRYTALQSVTDQMLHHDPTAALERVAALPPSPRRDDALNLAAARWARTGPEAALRWVRGKLTGELSTRVTTSIGFELAQTTPQAAIEVAATLPRARGRWLLLAAIGQTWVAQNSQAAFEWIKTLPPGEEHDAALAGAETGLGTASTRYAALLRGAFPGEPSREMIGQVGGLGPPPVSSAVPLPPDLEAERSRRRDFEELLLMSPAMAADWLNRAPASERTEEMIERVARAWLPHNPIAAEAWLSQIFLPFDRRTQLLRELRR